MFAMLLCKISGTYLKLNLMWKKDVEFMIQLHVKKSADAIELNNRFSVG